jgi:hypothetical protein
LVLTVPDSFPKGLWDFNGNVTSWPVRPCKSAQLIPLYTCSYRQGMLLASTVILASFCPLLWAFACSGLCAHQNVLFILQVTCHLQRLILRPWNQRRCPLSLNLCRISLVPLLGHFHTLLGLWLYADFSWSLLLDCNFLEGKDYSLELPSVKHVVRA